MNYKPYKLYKLIPMRSFLCFCSFFLVSVISFAQQTDSVAMHGKIDTVLVQEKKTQKTGNANSGSRVSIIEMAILNANRTKSLAELLADNSALYIKSLGQGALSTASFRGTSSAHTRVNWNGININPPMSSTFDFSQIPVFFIDNAELVYGGGQIKTGSGGLGGNINLSNAPDWNKTQRILAFSEYGSYSTYTLGAAIRLSARRSQYQTKVYFQHSDNDYTYVNKVLAKDPFREKRAEAAYKQLGVMQEAYFKVSDNTLLSTNLWLQYGDRQLPQPIMISINKHENQKELALKGYIGLDHTRDAHRLSLKGAYMLNTLDYKLKYDTYHVGNTKNKNYTHTYYLNIDYSYDIHPSLSLNTSLNYTHDRIKTDSYNSLKDSTDLKTRNILTWQGNVKWNATSWLLANGQVMAELNEDKLISTYSVGFLAQIIPGIIHAKTNIAYNYRFPSMNDLYWEPGGNPNLRPEKGFSYDILFAYTPYLGEHFSLKTELSAYLIDLKDWILWLPSPEGRYYWTPQNRNKVRSYGSELYIKGEYNLDKFTGNLSVNYAYSSASNNKKHFEEDASYKKQLPYVPKHKGNARLSLEYNKWNLSYQANYTGIRYTTVDESYRTNAYTIHNASLGYTFSPRERFNITTQFRVENLFDAFYESTQYYPMPLRNFLASVMIEF